MTTDKVRVTFECEVSTSYRGQWLALKNALLKVLNDSDEFDYQGLKDITIVKIEKEFITWEVVR